VLEGKAVGLGALNAGFMMVKAALLMVHWEETEATLTFMLSLLKDKCESKNGNKEAMVLITDALGQSVYEFSLDC
jgi:hypothetical protein